LALSKDVLQHPSAICHCHCSLRGQKQIMLNLCHLWIWQLLLFLAPLLLTSIGTLNRCVHTVTCH